MRLAALALAAFALSGCQTTQEESAKLAKQAKRMTLAGHGLSIARPSTVVKVLGAVVVHSSEGAAAVVTVRNSSFRVLAEVPIAITVGDARGRTLFQNNARGLEAGLVSIPSLRAHERLSWVDDQLPSSGQPATVTAEVGEARAVAGGVPAITVAGTHLIDDPTNGVGASGTVSNHSAILQRNLVVFALARRAGRIAAAARGVLPELAGGASAPFQVFFVGDPHGAQLQVSVPPTSLR